jgi:hypothetical protein
MNRWIFALLARRFFLLLAFVRSPAFRVCVGSALVLGVALGGRLAQAQSGRSFPAQVQQAQLQVTQAPEILLNGKPARLAPGARIRGTNDLLLLPGALTGQILRVHVLTEPGGLVKEVWILSPEEAAQAAAQP